LRIKYSCDIIKIRKKERIGGNILKNSKILLLEIVKIATVIGFMVLFGKEGNWIYVAGAIIIIVFDLIIKRLFKSSKQVDELKTGIKEVAEGNLSKKFSAKDVEFKEIADNLNKIMQDYRSALAQILYNSEQTSNVTKKLASATEDTNKALEDIAKSVEHMVGGASQQENMIESVIKETKNLEEISNDTSNENVKIHEQWEKTNKDFDESKHNLEDLADGMVSRTSNNRNVLDKAKEMSQNIKEINNIVGLVRGISEQTNMLALNAAIEAARAGEYGKGFSVVADEVRKLAEETKKATDNIDNMIMKFGNEISFFLNNLEESINKELLDTEKVQSTKSSFEKMTKSLSEVDIVINNTKNKMETQKDVLKKVLDSLTEVFQISQETAAGTEEISASVEEQSAIMAEISRDASALDSRNEESKNILQSSSKIKIEKNKLDNIINNNKKIITELAGRDEIRQVKDNCKGVFKEFLKKYPGIDAIYFYDINGKLLADSEEGMDYIDPSDRPWFQEAIKGEVYVSDLYLGIDCKKVIVTASSPVYNLQNEIVGIIGLDSIIES
jgi:methyl-accepting chemotaxis protein